LLTSHYEGYGRTIVEAAAAGLPVLATDVGIASDYGDAVPVDDTEELIKKLRLVIENSEYQETLIKKSEQALIKNALTKTEFLQQQLEAWQNCTKK